MVEFGNLTPEGYEPLGNVSQEAIKACPHLIIEVTHYRPDGSCRCDDPDEQQRMIDEWGYSPSDFFPRRKEP